MTILWSFSYNSFVKFNLKTIGSHKITMLYPNLCYNVVFYKGTALYLVFTDDINRNKMDFYQIQYVHLC